MKYELIKNDEGYITGMIKSDKGIELDLSKIKMDHLDCYQQNGQELILNTEKLNQEIESELKQNRIDEIMKELDQTDYVQDKFIDSMLNLKNPVTFISDMISLMSGTLKDYQAVISKRTELVNELETLIK